MPWYIIPFDEDGNCAGPRTRDRLLDAVAAGDFTDIVVFSHGWNNNWRQATERYEHFFDGTVRMRHERNLPARLGFKPLLVGIFWPSMLMVGDADRAPEIAADIADDDAVEAGWEELHRLSRFVAPGDVPRLFELAQLEEISEQDALELAAILAPLYATDGAETGEPDAPSAAAIVASWRVPPTRRRSSDPADFGRRTDLPADPGGAADPVAAGWLDFLKPTQIIRGASVWLMKDRAGRVGARGVAPLLARLLESDARVHVAGHSFGAKVMLSAIAAPAQLAKPVHSALLLQPAVSHLCFAANANGKGRPGGYRSVLDRVGQPILATFSKHDAALTKAFHLALRRDGDIGEAEIAADEPPSRYAALGGFGPRPLGVDTALVDVLDPGQRYGLDDAGRQVVGVRCDRTISDHGDISNPSCWWMLYDLMTR
ncbi:hypothetical protein OHA72_34955 [Dactylosporangium sp. NBC_01737]|uniref:hypothetical protein n=1 Tax=Dactylosporangium sp. NBC_01737 TaxID=2975959 RepID=UPI002E0E101F|nr:hypothetical protein OHA72_34955 [Dactylosporangium sp. NBC_01737]